MWFNIRFFRSCIDLKDYKYNLKYNSDHRNLNIKVMIKSERNEAI
jgi:hypothetical protein